MNTYYYNLNYDIATGHTTMQEWEWDEAEMPSLRQSSGLGRWKKDSLQETHFWSIQVIYTF